MRQVHRQDFTNQRFGRLVVIKERLDLRKPNSYTRIVECKCDCGKIKAFILGSLKTGHTKSCGCLNKELITKHGLSHHP